MVSRQLRSEVPTARLAAANRKGSHVDGLHEVIENETAISADDPSVSANNARFHTILADASGNRVLTAFVHALHRIARPLAFIDTSPEVGRQAGIHHIAIARAVRNQAVDTAGEAISQHLEYLREHVIATDGDKFA